jgi:hypothetical protein
LQSEWSWVFLILFLWNAEFTNFLTFSPVRSSWLNRTVWCSCIASMRSCISCFWLCSLFKILSNWFHRGDIIHMLRLNIGLVGHVIWMDFSNEFIDVNILWIPLFLESFFFLSKVNLVILSDLYYVFWKKDVYEISIDLS